MLMAGKRPDMYGAVHLWLQMWDDPLLNFDALVDTVRVDLTIAGVIVVASLISVFLDT